jgi:hypothetical protein
MKKLIMLLVVLLLLGCSSVIHNIPNDDNTQIVKFNSESLIDNEMYTVSKKDSNGILVEYCLKYTPYCINDTFTIIFESVDKTKYSLIRKNGTSQKIERANLNSIDY